MDFEGLIFTNDNCISCNKCVKVCTSPGASYLHVSGDTTAVYIDPMRCVSCGACFALCEHNARDYRDDTLEFFRDLEAGVPISILIAPAFKASYPDEYASILGGLKALGVRRIINVAFGADICTWAYLKYMQEEDFIGGISTTCPVAVSYIEHCIPELIPRLMPVESPMICAATFCREELGITDRLAFIGPCISKKLETDTYTPKSPVHYNVTFLKLMKYVREHHVYGRDASDEIEYGLGSFYPAPGGLADNIRWFLGDDAQIRIVSGKTYLYGWIKKNAGRLIQNDTPFILVDALNCQDGCIEGTASESGRFEKDDSFFQLQRIRQESKREVFDSPWSTYLTPAQRLEKLNEQFQHLSFSHYLRRFTDRSEKCGIQYPSEDEADRIFNEMHKTTPASRRINCSTCGYNSCYDMMVAIYNRFNNRRSCIYYEKEEALRMERLSYSDALTGVMNRNALERMQLDLQYTKKSVCVIAADIDGLKEANDTFGHDAGDNLIKAVSSCLSCSFGLKNVFRTGGDEFIIIWQDHTEEECIREIRRVKQSLQELEASASIGYAFTPAYEQNFPEMRALADKEMYSDKARYYQTTGKKRR